MSGLNICKSARITQSAPGCDDGGQGEGGSDVAGELVVIGGDAAEILEAAEHRLDPPTVGMAPRVEADPALAAVGAGNDHADALLAQLLSVRALWFGSRQ
jgi:hypothetical protein